MAEEPIPEWRKAFNYPLVVETDLDEDLQSEIFDLIGMAIDRSQGNLEICSKAIKADMDNKMGPSWNVVIGENFSHFVTYTKNMLFAYFGGNLGVLIWK